MSDVLETAGMEDRKDSSGGVDVLSGGGQATDSGVESSGGGMSAEPTSTPVGQGAAPQQNNPNKKDSRASSGMFTNIQRYVEKNKPQAQRMSKAVQKDIGQQASEIRKVTQEKSANTQQRLDANKALMDKQRADAQATVNQIMQTSQPEPNVTDNMTTNVVDSSSTNSGDSRQNVTAMSTESNIPPSPIVDPAHSTTTPEEIQAAADPLTQDNQQNNVGQALSTSEFQKLLEGAQGIQELKGVNLAQENLKAQALKSMTDRVRGEAGRRDLLRTTFGDGREYTRGMSGLDNLILGGDRDISKQFIEQAQQQGKTISSDVQGLQKMLQGKLSEQTGQIRNFGEDVKKMATDERDPMFQAIKDEFNSKIIERAMLTGNADMIPPEVREIMTPDQIAAMESGNIAEIKRVSKILAQASRMGSYDLSGVVYKKREQPLRSISDGSPYQVMGASALQNNTKEQKAQFSKDWETIDNMSAEELEYLGIDKAVMLDLMKKLAHESYVGGTDSYRTANARVAAFNKEMEKIRKYKGQYNTSLDDFLADEGYTYEDVLAGSDISMGDIAGATQAYQYNQLNELLGENNRIEYDPDDKGYLDNEALKRIMERYKNI